MTTNDQLGRLMETLQQIRDTSYPEIPDELLEKIVSAHAEDPDSSGLHRRVQRAIEALATEGDSAST